MHPCLIALRLLLLTALAPAALAAPAAAPHRGRPPTRPVETQTKPTEPRISTGEDPLPPAAATHHSLGTGDKKLPYEVTAGHMLLRDDLKPLARIFYVAYTARPQDRQRPITFAFNGGPGASSVFLHLGVMGPRRAVLGEGGTALPRQLALQDNEHSWLGFSDLVFVDPVGTGYSLPAEGVEAKTFYAMNQDVRTLSMFIRQYLSVQGRWLSPVFLAGESYGATRAAAMAEQLQDEYGLKLSGLVLVSAALNFLALDFAPGNDLPYVLYVPSYTAVAWYHKRLAGNLQRDLQAAMEESKRWAVKEFAPALAMGDALPPQQRKAVLESLARYTGLPVDFLSRANLRVSQAQFAKRLLEDQGRIAGILDARVTSSALRPTAEHTGYDASLFLVFAPFAATMQHYLHDELDYRTDLRYEYLSRPARQAWKWDADNSYVNVGPALRSAMIKNPRLKVLALMGYYDLATGYFAQDYMYDHLHLPADQRANLKRFRYESGHQIYNHPPSLEKMSADVRQFYREAD